MNMMIIVSGIWLLFIVFSEVAQLPNDKDHRDARKVLLQLREELLQAALVHC